MKALHDWNLTPFWAIAEHTCSSDDEREECRMLSNEFAANYDAVDLHVFSGNISTLWEEVSVGK